MTRRAIPFFLFAVFLSILSSSIALHAQGATSDASIPVGFSAAWTGSLATFFAPPREGTKRRYGLAGNTFVAVVEFGDRVRAKAIRAGGQSGDPKSPHFDDQALRYATGDLRDVYVYRSDLDGHIEREYRPGR